MRAKRYAMNVGKRIPQNNNIRCEHHHTYTINYTNNLVLTTKIITGVSVLNCIIHQMSSPGKYRENIPPRNSRLHLSETQNIIQDKICFRWKKINLKKGQRIKLEISKWKVLEHIRTCRDKALHLEMISKSLKTSTRQ